jgi:glycosyltransferase involved in cell wall biosynthesis
MNPIVSVILCTRNRLKYLAAALGSIGVQEFGPELCEIIVVDNASSDTTREYVCSRASEDPTLHYVLEPIVGLSRARNTGIQAARGQYLAPSARKAASSIA